MLAIGTRFSSLKQAANAHRSWFRVALPLAVGLIGLLLMPLEQSPVLAAASVTMLLLAALIFVLMREDARERRLAENALQESRRFIESITEHSTSIIFVFDLDTMTNVYSNRNVGTFLGYSIEQVQALGDALLPMMVHPDDLPLVLNHFEKFADARDGDVVDLEYRVRHADGDWRWVWNREVVFNRHPEGRARQILGTVQDITQRRQAEDALRRSQARLAEAQQIARIGSWEYVPSSGEMVWSEETFHIFGFDPHATMPNLAQVLERYHPDDMPLRDRLFADALAHGTPYEIDLRIFTPDGKIRWCHAVGMPICDAAGKTIRVVGTTMDITERKQSEDAARRADEKYRSIYENAVEGIFQTSPDGRLLSANPAMARMHGFDSPAQMVSQITDIGRQLYVRPGDRRRLLDLMAEHGRVNAFETPQRRRDGAVIWISMNARAVNDDTGGILWFEGTAEDITERQEAEQRMRDYSVVLQFQKAELEKANAELEALATQDGLTGLKNHRAFQDRLADEWGRASRYQTPLSLLMLDVDFFKQYNDTFGHPAGDEVLKQVSRLLEGAARETDFAARYGGEEFAVLLPHTDYEGAMRLAERVRSAIAAGDWTLRPVTASVGVATLRPDMPDAAALIAAADRALYRAKADGRNRVTHDAPDWGDKPAQVQTV